MCNGLTCADIHTCNCLFLLGDQAQVVLAPDDIWPGKTLLHFPWQNSFLKAMDEVQTQQSRNLHAFLFLISHRPSHSLSQAPGRWPLAQTPCFQINSRATISEQWLLLGSISEIFDINL